MSLTADFQTHIVIHFENTDFLCPTAFLYLTLSFIPSNRTSIFCYTYSSTLSLAISNKLTQNIFIIIVKKGGEEAKEHIESYN